MPPTNPLVDRTSRYQPNRRAQKVPSRHHREPSRSREAQLERVVLDGIRRSLPFGADARDLELLEKLARLRGLEDPW